MTSENPGDLLLIGRIFRAHGIKGEVKVAPETDVPERFLDLQTVYLGKEPIRAEPFEIEEIRFQPAKNGLTLILKLSGIETRESAEALMKAGVYVYEDDLPPLEEDEVFLHDLVGLSVLTEDDTVVGSVKDVLEMPAQLVYVVERVGRSDVMIPDVPDIVIRVDLKSGQLVIRPIEGLLD